MCRKLSPPITSDPCCEHIPNPRGAAPPLELRSEDGAFAGAAASTFLVLPETESRYAFSLHWDLSALPSVAVGMSSMGSAISVWMRRSRSTISNRRTSLAARSIAFRHSPRRRDSSQHGREHPPCDDEELMRWTEQLYNYYLDFFRANHVEPFAVLPIWHNVSSGR
jgi:hypothetical protein